MKFRLQRYPTNINPKPILEPRKNIDWESSAVFNPSVTKFDDKYVMLYRTYPSNFKKGVLRGNRPGYKFINQISYIGYAISDDGINFERSDTAFISPDSDFDKYGCEDPRISKIGDTYYITYTAIDAPLDSKEIKPNIRIALASTKDFINITKHGIIGPSKTSKAAAFFESLVRDNEIGMALTVSSDSSNSHVAIRYYSSMEHVLNSDSNDWDSFLETSKKKAVLKTDWWLHRGPELGAQPIKTSKGWLLLYSSESMSSTWTISAALLDLNDPSKLIARTPGYIMQAVTEYELNGLVPNVTFPSGAQVINDTLYVYYGAADTVIGLAQSNLNDLLEFILNFKEHS